MAICEECDREIPEEEFEENQGCCAICRGYLDEQEQYNEYLLEKSLEWEEEDL